MRTLGEDNVALEGEHNKQNQSEIKLIRPEIFTNSREKYDLIVNADSMTEMGRAVADGYWDHAQERAPQFLSINHEVNEFTVRDISIERGTKIQSCYRNAYPIRKGYIEELFSFAN